MKTKPLALTLVLALLLGGTGVWVAGAAQSYPSIISFESSLPAVTMADAEAGTATTTLSWATVGVTGEYRLILQAYKLNRWETIFDQDSVPLDPNGSRTVTVEHPLNFGPPTYVLSIVDADTRYVDQRVLSIPYDLESVTDPPTIDTFEASVESVDATQLAQGIQVGVSWQVSNRVPTANLVFEQVFPDGTAQSVELPRPYRWVRSAGQGTVAPVFREGATTLRLRLRVVDLVSEEVYDEQEIELTITGAVSAAPTDTIPPAAVEPPPSAEIVSFTASPATVNPGAAVTLAWEVQGTGGVVIEQWVPHATTSQVVVEAQSPTGTTTVYLPDNAAYSVTYTLWAASHTASTQTEVKVHCPYTFFFGEGDGCPSSPPVETVASYQAFEGGYMLWRGDTNEIYIHYTDGDTQDGGSAQYFLESSYALSPEAVIEDPPPLDRVAPVRGFGKVWANAPDLQERLGWALAAEEGYTMRLQQVAISREPAPEFLFYLTLPDESTVGTGFGRWQVIE